MHIASRFLPVVLALPACSFDYLEIEIESRDVCLQDLESEVPAEADGSASAILEREPEAGGEAEEIPEEAEHALDLPEGWEVTRVTLESLTVEPKEGVAALSFIEKLRAHIKTLDPYADLPEVELFEFIHGEDGNYTSNIGSTLHVEGNGKVDLDDYFDTESIELALEMEGDLPDVDWKVGVEPCFTFVAKYRREL